MIYVYGHIVFKSFYIVCIIIAVVVVVVAVVEEAGKDTYDIFN